MIPNTKVFIGSLPPGAKPQELRRLFENFGVVTECDIMNRCGFVHMESAEVAEKAIQGLNNSYFMGQTISVEPGRMKERRPPIGRGGEEGAARGGGRPPYSRGGDGYNSNGFQRGGGGPNSSRIASNNIDLGGGAPIRRSNHSAPARNVPYARYGGGQSNGGGGSNAGGYERRNYYGGSPSHNDAYGSPNGGVSRYSTGGSSTGGARYNPAGGYGASSPSYLMGSQDRRGFALPDRHTDEYAASNMYNDHMHSAGRGGELPPYAGGGAYRVADDISYQQRRTPVGYGSGDHQQYGQLSPYPYEPAGYGGPSSSGGGSYGATSLNTYNRRPVGSADGSSGSSASYGRSSYGSASGFNNQDFPPLGSSSSVSRSYPSGPQPSRREAMPDSRY